MRELAQIFKALGDETRIKMLSLVIRYGELCVCDFEQGMGISQSKASRHLRCLANAGLLEDRREAVWVYYHLPLKPEAFHKGVAKLVEEALPQEEFLELETRFKKWLKSKGCNARIPQRAAQKDK
ncbi:MAG: hypothetical protein A2428_12485 [Bdellovibrionales bacterium RIFOXYC1_FULL_54_43]|nr:MAG: hypothetical protein A2428_12485 [Bdellovibrionales bacterium RIFOXYC1_FULL_54_43]OFZ78770.1 MAG: hypothetical protein A2603_00145 [Bdellovibrionales bacterium RIFOXYD1_FULL_55_31]